MRCTRPSPIVATILLDSMAGVAIGAWTVLAMCIMTGSAGIPLFLSGMVATIVSAATADRVRTRSRVMRTGIIAGLAQIFCVFGITAVHAADSQIMMAGIPPSLKALMT